MRHVGHMAGIDFDHLGVGALRHHPLLVRINRSVCGSHHVERGFVLPGRILNLMSERVGRDRHLRYSHKLCLIPWDVGCEVSHKMLLFYPPVVVAVWFEGLGRLWQGLLDGRTALAFIESKGGDVNECCNLWMIASLGDDGPAITVPHQNHWSVHGVDSCLCVLLVIGVRGLGVLPPRPLLSSFLRMLATAFQP